MGLKRAIHPETLAALRGRFHPVALVRLDWPGEEMRLHSGHGMLSWGGHQWRGVGQSAAAKVPAEARGMAAAPMTLAIQAGLPPDIWDMLAVPIRNRDGELWMACTRDRGGQGGIIGAPFDLYGGYMDASRYVQREGKSGPIHAMELDLKSGPGARRAASVFHSYEDQMREFPGDTAGRLTINIVAEGETLTWPA